MIGKLIERLFVQVRADLSELTKDLNKGVADSKRATDQMGKQWTSMEAYVESYRREIQQLSTTMASAAKASGAALSPIGGHVQQAFNPVPIKNFGRSMGQARMQMMNLGYQINDIGMTLATGANPMTVLIQQGSQIAQIYGGQGGVRAAMSDIGGMLGGLAKRAWPLAIIAGGFGILTREINKTSGVTVTFGDVLMGSLNAAWNAIYPFIEGPLNDLKAGFAAVLDFIAEWFPKIMNGIIGAGVFAVKAIGVAWDLLPYMWQDVWATVKNTTLEAIEFIINLVVEDLVNNVLKGANMIVQALVFAFRAIKVVWEKLPDLLGDAMASAVNLVLTGVEKLVDGAVDGIKNLLSYLDVLPDSVKEAMGIEGILATEGKSLDLSQYKMAVSGAVESTMADIGTVAGQTFNENFLGEASDGLDPVDLSGQMSAGAGNVWGKFGSDMAAAFNEAFGTDYMGAAFEAIKSEAIAHAMERVAAGAQDIGGAARQAGKEVEDLIKKLEEGLTTAADNLAGVFGEAFEQLAETGKLTFGDFVRSLDKLLIQSTSKMIQEQLSMLFQSMVKNSFGGIGSLFGNIFTGLFGGGNAIGARAGGGVEMPWRSFVAGERGTELITQDGPAGARRVSTAGRTAAMGAGAARPVSVTFVMPQGTDMNQFRKSQGQISSKLAAAVQRGGRNR